MTEQEAIKELEWVYKNDFVNDLNVIGTSNILDAIRMAIEALEKANRTCKTCVSNDGTYWCKLFDMDCNEFEYCGCWVYEVK